MKSKAHANAITEQKVRPLLRLSTAGSVDDGKSTLIGRLIYDAKGLFDDQLQHLEKKAQARGKTGGEIDLAALTDGLRSEQEQGITIDVAYRYFSTPQRKFIIADTPGHEQYTRNMVTGASTADCAIVLVDAVNGLTRQTIRHFYIAVLLGIRNILVVVNKMDLVAYSPLVYENIRSQFIKLSARLLTDTPAFIPISALAGDNVVDKSNHTPWYPGPSVLDWLETLDVTPIVEDAFRLPVQYVIRPNGEFRGYAGRLTSGTLTKGEKVTVLPSMRTSTVTSLWIGDRETDIAEAGDSIVVTIADHLDISRGDMIVPTASPPVCNHKLVADLVWMDNRPLEPGRSYLFKHGTKTTKVIVDNVTSRIDVEKLQLAAGKALELNEIGRCLLHLQVPLPLDSYTQNRATGSFIVIDPETNTTAGAGMVVRTVH